MFTTEKCCYCASLRTGCLIIGWTQLILAGIATVLHSILKVNDNKYGGSSGSFWGDIALFIFQMAVSFFLLYGVLANRRHFLLNYIVIEGILITTRLFLVVFFLVWDDHQDILFVIFLNTVLFVFQGYLLVVVYSHYTKMSSINPNV